MRVAPEVFLHADEIARLHALVDALRSGAHVELHLADGDVLRGIVSDHAEIMVFFDPDGREGTNGTVRLEQPAMEDPEAAGWRDVWLGEIVSVRRLDPQELLSPGDQD